MRLLPLLLVNLTLALCSVSQVQAGNSPLPMQDGILAAAIAACDNAAEQAKAVASAPPPFEPTHILSPVLLLADAAARKKQQDELPARLALIEQNRLQCQENARAAAAMRVQEARNQAKDIALGYQHISIEDFVLDAVELARQGKRVSLQGSYILLDKMDLLYANQMSIIQATHHMGGNQLVVPLLADSAPRAFRQFLLHCQTNPLNAQLGCPVAITGIVTTCQLTGPLSGDRELPCVEIQDGRPL
jgi:hypothetical protein